MVAKIIVDQQPAPLNVALGAPFQAPKVRQASETLDRRLAGYSPQSSKGPSLDAPDLQVDLPPKGRRRAWSATKIVQSFASTSPTSGGADIQPVEGGSDRKVSFDRTNPISLAGSGRLDPARASSSSTKTAEGLACDCENRPRPN